MRTTRIVITIGLLLSLIGCAHPISIAPKDDGNLRTVQASEKIKKKVGLYIPPESLSLEVTTPGGGGDNVRYFPYRDLAVGYRRMLNNVFEDVVSVAKSDEVTEFERTGVAYVITPELTTSSGSTGFFTWPPTNFTVDLTSNIRNASGKLLYSPRSIGVGSIGGILEMGGNHGITGQLAIQDALQKTQIALFETFDKSQQQQVGDAKNSALGNSNKNGLPEIRLAQLKELLDKKLISNDNYEAKKKEILDGL